MRGGCPGPSSSVGLTPDGYFGPVVPMGILMGAAGLALAVLCGWWVRGVPLDEDFVGRSRRAALVDLAATGGVAVISAVGSIWLPSIDAVSRQLFVAIGVAVVCAGTATWVARTGCAEDRTVTSRP